MIPYNTAKINQMINESQSSSTTYDKGRKFEDLACYLFETIPGITIAKRNAMNQYDTEEVDVSIWNDKHQDGLSFINNIFWWSARIGVVR